MKLFREIKEGQTWISIQESGVWVHLVAIENPDVELWEEITDESQSLGAIEYIDKHYIPATNKNYLIISGYITDYIKLKDIIRDIADSKGGWNYLTTEEKYLIIKYYIYRDLNTEKVTFLMQQGMSQQQAMQYLVVSWFKHNKYGSFIDSIMQRWKFTQFYLLMMCTKETVELELEREDIAHSVDLMEQYGVVGSDYGDTNRKGIMNYFNSSGLYIDNGFLESGIACYPGITKEIVLAQVIDVMINGNYDLSICNIC